MENLNVGKELTALGGLTVKQLRQRYAEVFGGSTSSRHKDFLIKRIIWRLQAAEEGELAERARRRAAELANDAGLRPSAPRRRSRRLPARRSRAAPCRSSTAACPRPEPSGLAGAEAGQARF